MTHYEVLGVRSDATQAEVRQAYLALARRHHPDRVSPSERARSENRMRVVNAAWAVLGDEQRRRRYDAEMHERRRVDRRPNAPAPGFVPLDDDETDYAALLDDTPLNATRVPRLLQVLPAMLLIFAILATTAGFVAQLGPLLGLGVVSFVLGILSFGAAPAFVVFRSRQDELR